MSSVYAVLGGRPIGRTPDSGSGYPGSSPGLPANLSPCRRRTCRFPPIPISCPYQKPRRATTRSYSYCMPVTFRNNSRSEEHTSELQSRLHLVCRLLLEKKKHLTQYLGDCTDTLQLAGQ